MTSRPWFVYLIECVDGSIYTGIAVDVAARYAKHLSGKGARYTRSHPPARLLGTFEYSDRSEASKAEYVIRNLDPRAKRELVTRPVQELFNAKDAEKMKGRKGQET